MKTVWNLITLARYETPSDPARIPASGWLGTVAFAVAVWAAWSLVCMIVRG